MIFEIFLKRPYCVLDSNSFYMYISLNAFKPQTGDYLVNYLRKKKALLLTHYRFGPLVVFVPLAELLTSCSRDAGIVSAIYH